MKTGVKFCGGCNPKYDRGRLYQKIRDTYPEIDFAAAKENTAYDVLLVISGCERECANLSGYMRERTVKVSEDVLPEI